MVDTMIRIFEPGETEFLTNGLGSLFDASKCEVVEERNGAFELEMEYHVSGKRFHDLQLRRIIVAQPNPYARPQPFRIYEISKPMNGLITVKAEHISYDMAGYPVSPFTASGASSVLSGLNSGSIVNCPFRFSTDLNASGEFSLQKPVSMRSLLGGSDGSILDTYGGEYEFDGFQVILHTNRGQNRGVTIRYGKNMTDLKQEENCGNVYTAVYPFWYSDEWGLIELPEKTVPAPGSYNFTRIYPLDLSSEWENSAYEWEDEYPTEDEIRALAKKFISENKIGIPTVSLTVSFEQLSQSGEYAALDLLETVRLCDTVSVEFPKLGVRESSKCIKTTYNVLTGKYISIELGETSSNLENAIVSRDAVVKKVKKDIVDINESIVGINENVDDLTVSLEKTSTGLEAEVVRAKGAENELSGRITLTASELKTEFNDKANGLQSQITQTAASLKTEFTDKTNGLQSQITQTAASLKTEFTNTTNGLQSQITQTAGEIAQKVSGSEFASYKTQTDREISQKVSKGGVISEINQSPESVSIDASKINLNGAVTANRNFKINLDGTIESTGGTFTNAYFKDTIYLSRYGNAYPVLSVQSDGYLDIGSSYTHTTIKGSAQCDGSFQVSRIHGCSAIYYGTSYPIINVPSSGYIDIGSSYAHTTIKGSAQCDGIFQVSSIYGRNGGDLTFGTNPVFSAIGSSGSSANVYVGSGNRLNRITSSARRYKNSIQPVISAELDPHRLYDIPVVQFRFNTSHLNNPADRRYNREVIGLVADDVAKYYPIAADFEDGLVENWNDRYLIPPMLYLLQEQHKDDQKIKAQMMAMQHEMILLKYKMEGILC